MMDTGRATISSFLHVAFFKTTTHRLGLFDGHVENHHVTEI